MDRNLVVKHRPLLLKTMVPSSPECKPYPPTLATVAEQPPPRTVSTSARLLSPQCVNAMVVAHFLKSGHDGRPTLEPDARFEAQPLMAGAVACASPGYDICDRRTGRAVPRPARPRGVLVPQIVSEHLCATETARRAESTRCSRASLLFGAGAGSQPSCAAGDMLSPRRRGTPEELRGRLARPCVVAIALPLLRL